MSKDLYCPRCKSKIIINARGFSYKMQKSMGKWVPYIHNSEVSVRCNCKASESRKKIPRDAPAFHHEHVNTVVAEFLTSDDVCRLQNSKRISLWTCIRLFFGWY